MTSDAITQDTYELAKGMQIMQNDYRGIWAADDLISIFHEITSKLLLLQVASFSHGLESCILQYAIITEVPRL